MILTRSPFPIRDDRSPVKVEVSGIGKTYDGVTVLSDISFEVKAGEIFVIMGASGSGKSVLLRHICGLEVPTTGTIRINGEDPHLADTRDRYAVALVFQSGALFNSLSVYDNLALYPLEHCLCPKKEIRERVMRALRILSIEKTAKQIAAEHSGGMRKRVAIARALVMEPQLLLYDEPTSELDPVMAATIAEIIATLRDEYSVTSIVVSHDRDLSLTIGERIVLLDHGRTLALETPDELRANPDPIIREFLNPDINLDAPRFKNLENKS